MAELIEVTFHDGADGKKCIQLGMSREAFAEFMGYSAYSELMEAHGTWEDALAYWKSKWERMGFEVVLNN